MAPRLGAFGEFAFGQETPRDATGAASGAVIVCDASLIPGVATAVGQQIRPSVNVPRRQIVRRSAKANGVVLHIRARLVPGETRLSTEVSGASVISTFNVISGKARTSTLSRGQVVQFSRAVIDGSVSVDNSFYEHALALVLAEAA